MSRGTQAASNLVTQQRNECQSSGRHESPNGSGFSYHEPVRNTSHFGAAMQDNIHTDHVTNDQHVSDGFSTTFGTVGSDHDLAVWHAKSSVDYPDVSSYAQPYFYQQTDPSIYNSPWPPLDVPHIHSSSIAPYAIDVAANLNTPYPQTNQYASSTFTTGTGNEFPNLDSTALLQSAVSEARTGNSTGNTEHNLEDASMHLKLQSLSILDNLATQLIATITKANYTAIQDIIQGKDSELSQAYAALKSLFDQTRRVYSRDTAFIDAISIQMFQPAQQEVIRKANIATFVSSILGAHDVSFFHLNEYFLETFVPLGHRLLKWQGALYLELKTQTYISALINSDGDPEPILDELFPTDLDAQVLSRHPDAPSLSPSEQDFIDRSRSRTNYLKAEPRTPEALRELPRKYQWSDFVREFALCISKNADSIMSVPIRNPSGPGGHAAERRAPFSGAANVQDNTYGDQTTLAMTARSILAADQRQSSETPKKTSAPLSTVRQAWTKAEEDALLSGLGKVSGPHWSQILALYGRGGSESEVLKDRNQVQLKDKARNLKLWYLKMGKEVPTALQGVTGELRKRGGARARAALDVMEEEQNKNGEGLTDPDTDAAQDASISTNKKRGRK